jgi:hypothetical protein
MKYLVSATVMMTGSYDTEIEADTFEEAQAMAEEILVDLDSNQVLWNDEVQLDGYYNVMSDEDEYDDEDIA